MNTSNFTVTNNLFLGNPQVSYWRFEVVYSFVSGTSSSTISFVMNQPPQNGSCSISPLNGTTSTLFTIVCSSWLDKNGIKDYSFYGEYFSPNHSNIVTESSIYHYLVFDYRSFLRTEVESFSGNEQPRLTRWKLRFDVSYM